MSIQSRFILFGLLIVAALGLLAPTFGGNQFENWPLSKPINLGLDLKGGVSITYEVQAEEAIISSLQNDANEAKKGLLAEEIAVVSSKALPEQQLELIIQGSRNTQPAIDYMDREYPDLSMKANTPTGDGVRLVFEYGELTKKKIMDDAIEMSVESLRNRVDQFGVSEPLINRVEERRILLQMPGFTDVEKVKRVVGKTAKLEFRFIPQDSLVPTISLKDREGATVKVEDRVVLTGDRVNEATVGIVPGSGAQVELEFTREGGKLFSQITAENVGKNLAIILDGIVYSSPVIRERISGGAAVISGEFTIEEANELAIVLKSGALPASLKQLDQLIIGPSLGADSIRSGILAIVGGFVVILIFTTWYYRTSGLLAGITLVFNIFFLLALLSLFGATLTLPGLAGLALTIGIAVDSNIIIFERIRDELKAGRSMPEAIEGGFSKSFSAILDTNLSALITGVILFIFGTGAVKGFAVTLSLGVLTTLFGAIFIARLGFDWLLSRGNRTISI